MRVKQNKSIDRWCFFESRSSIFSVNQHNTEKLALPSISQVQPKGFDDQLWYQPNNNLNHATADRLPAFSHIQSNSSYASVGSSPRGGSNSSAEASCADTATSYSASLHGAYTTGLKTPSPEQNNYRKDSVHSTSQRGLPFTTYDQASGSYITMNGSQSYMDVSQSHMPSSIPSSAPPAGLSYPSSYQPSQSMHNASHAYGSSPTAYHQYAYGNGLAPMHTGNHASSGPMGPGLVQHSQLPLPSKLCPRQLIYMLDKTNLLQRSPTRCLRALVVLQGTQAPNSILLAKLLPMV